jgi:hypothetical protein
MPAVSKALALENAEKNIRFNTCVARNYQHADAAKDNHAALARFHPLGRTTLRCRKRHVRMVYGVQSLPIGTPVVMEVIFEID